jgi:tetratricopeptide (TPR) repeat protein
MTERPVVMKISRLLKRGRNVSPAETLLASPLNDAALVQAAFGSSRPDAARVEQAYFALPADQRPNLSPWFDVAYYRDANPDVVVSGLDAYLHFLAHGLEEGRNPHPLVDLAALRAEATRGSGADWNVAVLAEHLRRNPHALDPEEVELRRHRSGLTGNFDAIQDGLAQGWAFDPKDPAARLTVEIAEIVNDQVEVVGRGRGDFPRADLRQQGFGDGRYHFSVKLADALFDGKPHRLRARVGSAWLSGHHDFVAQVREREFSPIPGALTREIANEVSSDWRDRRAAARFVRRLLDANLQLGTREFANAMHELEALAAEHPGVEIVQAKLAEAKMRLGHADAAASLYETLTGSPRLGGWAWLGLGHARQSLGQWDQGEECYRRGFEVAPEIDRLASRVEDAGYRAARARARELANAGNAQDAIDLLAPELLARPQDREICDLVVGLLDTRDAAAGAGRGPMEPFRARAERSRRLLEVTLEQVERRIGAGR